MERSEIRDPRTLARPRISLRSIRATGRAKTCVIAPLVVRLRAAGHFFCLPGPKAVRNAGRVTMPVGACVHRAGCTQAKEAEARYRLHACVPHTTNFSACNSQQRHGA